MKFASTGTLSSGGHTLVFFQTCALSATSILTMLIPIQRCCYESVFPRPKQQVRPQEVLRSRREAFQRDSKRGVGVVARAGLAGCTEDALIYPVHTQSILIFPPPSCLRLQPPKPIQHQ